MTDMQHADHDELRRRMRDFADQLQGDPAVAAPRLIPERVVFARVYHRHRQAEAAAVAQARTVAPTLGRLADAFEQGERDLNAAYSAMSSIGTRAGYRPNGPATATTSCRFSIA